MSSAWHRTDHDRSSATPRSRRAHRCRLCTGGFGVRACCDTSRRPVDDRQPIRIPGPYGTVARIVWPRNGGQRNEDADPPGRIPGAHYDIPGDPPSGTTVRRVPYQFAYRLCLRCGGSRQNSSPTASDGRTSVRPENRPEAMVDPQHGRCLVESPIAPFPEINEAALVERERPGEWPIGHLNRAWSGRLAPENGSQDPAAASRGHPPRDETPALAGISLARPEELESPTS